MIAGNLRLSYFKIGVNYLIEDLTIKRMEQQILSSVIQMGVCISLLFALLLWIRRAGNRSRIYLSVAYAVCGIDLFMRVLQIYNGTPFTFEALNPAALYMALIEMPLFLFYFLEVISPGWLTWRKIVLLCSPWLLWNVCLLVPGLYFRELDSFRDVFRYIGEANVWLRLLFVLLMLSYSILIFRISYNWEKSSANLGWIRFYGAGYIALALFFILSSVIGSVLSSSLHLFYGTAYCFYITYYELFVRLNVPRAKAVGEGNVADIAVVPLQPGVPVPVPDESQAMEHESDPAVESAADNELWETLDGRMQKEKLWRMDMSLAEFAGLLDTNRTTLAALFKAKGYEGGYREYVNRHRIEDFLEIMSQFPNRNMQDAFFTVGYRSRMTAFRNFKEYVGQCPSEYFTNQSEE